MIAKRISSWTHFCVNANGTPDGFRARLINKLKRGGREAGEEAFCDPMLYNDGLK